jgi:hypothetical protein
MMKTCPWCNQYFTPSRDWQEFCCTDHRQRWHRHQRKLCEVRVAEAARANGRPNAAREIVDRFARLNAEIETAQAPAQSAEPFRRRL